METQKTSAEPLASARVTILARVSTFLRWVFYLLVTIADDYGRNLMVENTGDLEGKVALITGAANTAGIGFATARALAIAGARVVLADVVEDSLSVAVGQLITEGFQVAGHAVDISSEESVSELLSFTRNRFGRLDILDNNAATQNNPGDTIVTDIPLEIWDIVMAVNARGTMLMCKHALPLMITCGGGSIINISSGTAAAGDFHSTAYAASKGAINTFTRYVATQFGMHNIRCNALSLGLVMTSALESQMPVAVQDVFRNHTLNDRLGTPQDIAEVVTFLASDRSRFITGQVISIDGGFFSHVPTTVDIKRMAGTVTSS